MFKKLVRSYYKLFDEKLNNSTIIVLIIALLVAAIWVIVNIKSPNDNSDLKTSIIDSKIDKEIIQVDWNTYKLVK